MKSFYFIISAITCFFSFQVQAHSVQVRYCVSCNGDLRIWVEHWHGTENPASTTMTINLDINGNTTTQTSSPGGGVINVAPGNLPGCSSVLTYVTGCPGQQNTYQDWVYYDFTGLPQNVPITFTIISGNTVFTQDACSMYPVSVTFTIDNTTVINDQYVCAGVNTTPIQLGSNASWTNSNPSIGLPSTGNGAVQSFNVNGTPGTTATIDYTANCSSGSFDFIILPEPTTTFNTFSNGIQTTAVCIGNTFNFTDNSTIPLPDTIVSWLWDFGDGTTSSFQNPSHTYQNSGNYIVSLTTTSALGCSNSNYSQNITVFDLPIVNFTLQNQCANDQTVFTDASTVNYGTVNNWEWDILNDNSIDFTTSTGNYTFTTGGQYPVALTVTSSNGCSNTSVQNANIFYLPQVNFTSDSVCWGNLTSFTDQSIVTNGIITYWNWDFGGGFTGISPTPTNLFPTIGSHPINLTVTTNQGCVGNGSGNAFVYELPNVNFTITDACQNNSVITNNLSTALTGNLAYLWNFGDGSQIDTNSTHLYTNPGMYQVDLTATTEQNCTATATQMVKIYTNPTADFSVDTTCLSSNSSFINQSTINTPLFDDIISTYNWDFNTDGNINNTDSNPQHIFQNEGIYNTTLTITTLFGCTNSITKQAVIWPLPVVNFDYQYLCLNDATEFTDLSTISNLYTFNTIDVLNWNFGDGITMTCNCNNLSHLYQNDGSFGVKLSATSNNGCVNDTVRVVVINPLPNPNFVADSICVNTPPTTFTDLSTISNGTITNWSWDFGDGNVSSGNQASNTYSSDGYFNVTLTLTSSENCTSNIVKPIRVYEQPTALLTSDLTQACSPTKIQFTDLSYSNTSAIQSWFWDFGNGTTSTGQNPLINYNLEDLQTDSELFDITLTVTNSFGCSSTTLVSDFIEIYATPNAAFTFNPFMPSVTNPEVEFENTSTNADDYLWNFGNGQSSNEANPVHLYSDAGPNVYVAQLIAFNNGGMCSDTALATIQVDDVIIFYVPNAFTPDGDQYNNVWQPIFYSGYDPYNFHCVVFNRWGEVVWESFDASKGWNGKYGASGQVQDGTYVWKINFKESTTAKTHQYVGHVTVLQ